RYPRYTHSFPTRRSSDLSVRKRRRCGDRLIYTEKLSRRDTRHALRGLPSLDPCQSPLASTQRNEAGMTSTFQLKQRDGFTFFFRSEEHTSELQSRENVVC